MYYREYEEMVKDVRRSEIDASNFGEMRSLSSQLGEGVNILVAKANIAIPRAAHAPSCRAQRWAACPPLVQSEADGGAAAKTLPNNHFARPSTYRTLHIWPSQLPRLS